MEQGFENAAFYPPLKPLKPMECLQRRSGIGGELGAFPCTMLMAVGSCCSHHPASTLITSMNVRFNRLANHAEGVQYAITSLENGMGGDYRFEKLKKFWQQYPRVGWGGSDPMIWSIDDQKSHVR